MVQQALPAGGRLAFFTSTGRCGTQWLASVLAEAYPDLATVRHDPIGARYHPRDYFRQWDRAGEAARSDEAAGEVELMRQTIIDRTYVDTGWASYSMLPFLFREFAGRVRLVQLVRHPVPTAVSLVSLDMYSPARRKDEWTEFGFVDPWSPGVHHAEYQASWATMTAYERSLFWWTEIQLYAEELRERYPEVPTTLVRAEDMFAADGSGLETIVGAVGLPWRETLRAAPAQRYDRWRFTVDDDIDWRAIEKYPATLELMEKYGYSLDDVTDPVREHQASVTPQAKPWRPEDGA